MSTQLEANKALIARFNHEGIEQGNVAVLRELLAETLINHSAPAGLDNGPAGMIYTFINILHPAFSDLRVVLHDQVAEGDRVSTRKAITGIHTGNLLGLAPTHRAATIDVIDIFRVQDGKLVEHWGVNTLPSVMTQLTQE